MRLEIPLSLSARVEDVGRFSVDEDADGVITADSVVNPEVRLGLRFDSKMALVPLLLFSEYEQDLTTGPTHVRSEIEGSGLPNSEGRSTVLRKAWGRVSLGPYLHLGGGLMMSQWGLGLIANDGTDRWSPGSARFADPRGGDRVLRGFVASGPITDAKVFVSAAFDQVEADDILQPGDRGHQIVAAVLINRNEPTTTGIYVSRRTQNAANGGIIEATAIDWMGKARFEFDRSDRSFSAEAEVAIINGATTVAGTPDFPRQQIQQLGLALRGNLDLGLLGGVLDFLYASGDGDVDDEDQRGFKADPNYSMGLLLHRYVVAAHRARAVAHASNLEIVGVPARGVDRLPTRGSVSESVTFSPRAFVRPLSGLEIYGGPYFTWSTAPLSDPFNTRLAGGVARNGFDAPPGDYLGTEFDLGVRYRAPLGPTEFEIGLEGGLLIPGSALVEQDGTNMDQVLGARLLASCRI